jgi:hypothetical protein
MTRFGFAKTEAVFANVNSSRARSASGGKTPISIFWGREIRRTSIDSFEEIE